MVKHSHFYEFHEKRSHMAEFAGFEMPLWYEGITAEVLAVRNAVGLFDVSHMGRTRITGRDAQRYLDYMTSNDVSKLTPGDCHYTVMCNSAGGIIDDMVILRVKDEMFFVIFNASNREKDLNWMISRKKDFDVQVENVSDAVGLLAVQGPKAKETVQTITEENINIVKRFGCYLLQVAGEEGLISGTGYTGEDGFEISIFDSPVSEPNKALQVWNALIDSGLNNDLKPCGLGARDVLRLEAGMCLYGNELTDKTTPYEARIGFVVKLDKESEFIGRSILEKQKNAGVERIRVGLKLLKPGVPRKGYSIMHDNKLVGEVTSGTFSPTVKTGICMGYVPKDSSKRSTILQVEIRGKLIDAEVVRFPFYDTTQYGWMRS